MNFEIDKYLSSVCVCVCNGDLPVLVFFVVAVAESNESIGNHLRHFEKSREEIL